MNLNHRIILACTLSLIGIAQTASADYVSTVLSANPSAFYQLNQASGTTAVDSSGNGNNGTYVSPLTLNQPRLAYGLGTSTSLPGGASGGYVDVPSAAPGAWYSNTGTSFEVWFKTTSSGVLLGQSSSGTAVDGGQPGGWVPGLYVGTDGLLRSELFWKGSVSPETSAAAVNNGVTHMAAVVFNGGTETLYLDGAQIAQTTGLSQSGYAGNTVANYAYHVGVGYDSSWPSAAGGWDRFNGSMSDAAFFQTALTPQQIGAQYLAGTTPEPSAFVLAGLGSVGLLAVVRRRRKV